MKPERYGGTYTALLDFTQSRQTPIKAMDIADALGMDYETAAAWLGRALRRGHVERVDRGQYRATATE